MTIRDPFRIVEVTAWVPGSRGRSPRDDAVWRKRRAARVRGCLHADTIQPNSTINFQLSGGQGMVSRIIAGTIAALLASAFSQACIAPPERATTGHREIISEAQWIAVMRTGSLAGRGESIRADLQLVECLKGDCPEQWRVDNFFSLDFAESEIDEWSYYAHRASVFWTGVQYDLGSDCDLSAALSPNRLHLVFGPEHYGLGFSVIATPDDAWLDFVRQELAGQSPPFPIEVLGETYFEALEGAFIGTLRWDGRTVIVSHEELIPLNQDISSEIDGFLTAR